MARCIVCAFVAVCRKLKSCCGCLCDLEVARYVCYCVVALYCIAGCVDRIVAYCLACHTAYAVLYLIRSERSFNRCGERCGIGCVVYL